VADNGSRSSAPTNGTFPIRPQVVIQVVAYGIKPHDLTFWGRAPRPIAAARRVAYSLLHEESWLSWRAVAEQVGRDSTGTGWIASAARLADPDAVEQLRARLRSPQGQGSLW
jgi:hypothetical protein